MTPINDHERIIINLDLDCFYVACERLADPSLIGRPLGIQQKQILATTSYEARAQGVGKLCLVTEAKKRCPDLIIRSGEDLTRYRAHSRRSFALVRLANAPYPTERLGMDEIFCDVTQKIRAHLTRLETAQETVATDDRGRRWFALQENDLTSREVINGFWYDPLQLQGITLPLECPEPLQASPMTRIASHFAAYLRMRIHSELGFTVSAGVAPCKVLSKLASDMHKPDKQSVWHVDIARQDIEAQLFLAPFKVERLQGFGYQTGKMLRHKLLGEGTPEKGIWGDPDRHSHPYSSTDPLIMNEESLNTYYQTTDEADAGRRAHAGPLTVAQVRQAATEADMISWFDERIGKRLWGLLHGYDPAPVLATPDFPKQISIEDSYLKVATMEDAMAKTLPLITSLIRRLELELGADTQEAAGKEASAVAKTAWLRYPTKLRFSMRATGRGRISKSVLMPVETFDTTQTKETRAGLLLQGPIKRMMQDIFGIIASDPVATRTAKTLALDVHVINVAATDLSPTRPVGIRDAFSRAPMERPSPKLDESVLAFLPADLRREVEQQYGVKRARPAEAESKRGKPKRVADVITIDDSDEEVVESTSPSLTICPQPNCGQRVLGFAMAAHLRFHQMAK
ncbi:uncharacterized protein L969DRAFT_90803 [Mixia osmundae IAM 14324]|uniref:UmuC domain-containing protein n=1 Tax=Mixia osmundae (strain CBS 9802 / IAM 14324 / JCM 22182 / KY 12970) TaxID=764103 RepID=G7DW11_MIXOS|nr:uncharacterized protein L969DRAFT_90803 [Mixia osmundae IAM 14324]KEI36483.1 hypothetical protein L969DRAFT_90803 [Mixia osmundae IAM 14324]GAA94817.1 hypothetical protein E5Q_01471 [Mixia osmundae IAM 14324]